MNDRADDIHEWDAAYVLGSLSATDRALFETHLEGCDACMRSLAELSGLPGVLRLLPTEDALALLEEPDASAVRAPAPLSSAGSAPDSGSESAVASAAAGSADHVAPIRRLGSGRGSGARGPGSRRPSIRRPAVWMLAAAAVVLLAGGVALGSALRAGVSAPVADPAPAASAPSSDPDDGLPADAVSMRSELGDAVTAQLAVTGKPWGTRFDWSCEYAGGGAGRGAYDLVAIGDDGTRTVVATWGAGQAEATQLAATSSIPIDSIRSVEITPKDSDVALASRDL